MTLPRLRARAPQVYLVVFMLSVLALGAGCAARRAASGADQARAPESRGQRDAREEKNQPRSDKSASVAPTATAAAPPATAVPPPGVDPKDEDGAVVGRTAGVLMAEIDASSAQGGAVGLAPKLAAAPMTAEGFESFDTEAYAHVAESGLKRAVDQPLSTFSIDVDTASYSNVRRFIENGQLPPAGAVRIEEMLNYFRYDDTPPTGRDPFSVNMEIASCPWAEGHRLMRIGLRGREIPTADLPPRNLVFLLDVSGSMDEPNKLPLVKAGMKLLVETLRPQDRVGIVVYAGAAGLVLPMTAGNEQDAISRAIDTLQPGGSTNGAEGIQLAYELAERSFSKGSVNRVVLATDGDFNVGTTSEGELVRLIEKERDKGVFLTVLGFGMGNLKDSTMEMLADHGNGNYAYVDSLEEARKVLVREGGATLVTIAKDVKIQVEFNPAEVEAWRLVGYEDRTLAAEDFNDDKKDAGEIGAGHAVVALYELVPAGGEPGAPKVDPLRYQQAQVTAGAASSGEVATVKLRWKRPDADRSELLVHAVKDDGADIDRASDDLRFAAAVAAFGMVLRHSENAGTASQAMVAGLAASALGDDPNGTRHAFLGLAAKARALAPPQVTTGM